MRNVKFKGLILKRYDCVIDDIVQRVSILCPSTAVQNMHKHVYCTGTQNITGISYRNVHSSAVSECIIMSQTELVHQFHFALYTAGQQACRCSVGEFGCMHTY